MAIDYIRHDGYISGGRWMYTGVAATNLVATRGLQATEFRFIS
jgi:hypothetical protein